MILRLEKIYAGFFFIGFFFMPFNSDLPQWFDFLGAYGTTPSPIFFLIAIFFLLLHVILTKKIRFPVKSLDYSMFLLFIVVICFCTLINFPDILNYYFKQTSGVVRFIRQILAITLGGVLFFWLFFSVCRDLGVKGFFLLFRRVFLASFIIVFICGILEFLIISFHMDFLKPLASLFDYFPFVDITFDYRLQRLSATTAEPPELGLYLITISGFLFSYILTSKSSYHVIPFVLVATLAILSKSRMALVIILFQTLIGVFFAYLKFPKFRNYFNKVLTVGSILCIIISIVFWKPIYNITIQKLNSLDFTKVEYSAQNNSISNKSRFGIQDAILHTFQENPVFGVGWGQQAYESRFHYPKWATDNNYEFDLLYLNENKKDFPPAFNMYLRILAETGIVGFFIFMMFLCSTVLSIFQVYRTTKHQYIVVALIISFGGYFLNWLQIDSFKIYGFWLCLVILICLKRDRYESINYSDTSF